MNGTWWKKFDDLDPEQKKIVRLPIDGKYLIQGPPGCGKTNLLLLRAKFTAKSELHNILFLTFANCLADFIKTGIGSSIEKDQIMTYWSWARSHIQTYYPAGLPEYKLLFDLEDDTEKRKKLVRLLKLATKAAPTQSLYDAIFIDEAQDLSRAEIEEISRLSSRVTIAGDMRQGLYSQDGLEAKGFTAYEIAAHHRVGRKICKVADKLLPPSKDCPTLLENCRYREDLSESDAEPNECATVEAQYDAIIERLNSQSRVFKNELIGILFPKKKMLKEFRDYIADLDIASAIAFHDINDLNNSFSSSKKIHALTIHGAKGAEFRAIHIVRGEAIKFPLHRREVIFTAVTRAKTSVTLHFTGKISAPIKTAFAKPKTPTTDELFDEL